jgi:hypothetical protein
VYEPGAVGVVEVAVPAAGGGEAVRFAVTAGSASADAPAEASASIIAGAAGAFRVEVGGPLG